MNTLNSSVLLVEDDPQTVELLTPLFDDLGLRWEHCSDGRSGLDRALTNDFTLVISDLGLPKLGGIELCRMLREKKPDQLILILTAQQEELKAVLALELGADEFVRKPFGAMELRARIRAVLRRAGRSVSTETANLEVNKLDFGELVIDIDSCQAFISGELVPVTATEFQLLVFLAQHAGRVFSREELVESLWGASPDVYALNVRAHISRLRTKLREAGASRDFVETSRGFGYRFVGEQQQPA